MYGNRMPLSPSRQNAALAELPRRHFAIPFGRATPARSRFALTCQSWFQTPEQNVLFVNSQPPLTVNTSRQVALRVVFVRRATERDAKSASPLATTTSGDRPKESLLEEGCDREGADFPEYLSAEA
jgi:hypothetical protein